LHHFFVLVSVFVNEYVIFFVINHFRLTVYTVADVSLKFDAIWYDRRVYWKAKCGQFNRADVSRNNNTFTL